MLALTAHLWAKHGMTEEKYRRKFPNESLISERMRAEKTEALRRPPHWEPVWSREYIVDYLIYKQERGEDLSPWFIYRYESALHANAKKYFGSYRAAIETAGIDYREIRAIDLTERWTPAKVLERIRKLHREKPLDSTGDVRRRDSRLYDRCHHYFGGVVSAVEAAGIPYVGLEHRRCLRWTKHTVLHAIRVLDTSGISLSPTSLQKHLDGQAPVLLSHATEYFGSWGEAVRTAGINSKCRRHRARVQAG